jgi:aminoglycoside phosphotransferase (APT) family kinase protein
MAARSSATKVPLTPAEVSDLVQRILGRDAGPRSAVELTGGMFNVAYGLELADGSRAVLKVAPPAGVPVLSYEHDLVAAELEFVDRAGAAAPTPAVLGRCLDGPRPAFVMSTLPGAPLDSLELSDVGRATVRAELGRCVARLRAVTGEAFGYLRPDGSFRASSWSVAFAQMVRAILADARRWQVALPSSAGRLLDLVERSGPLLDQVEVPVLTHFDLWDGNLFVLGDGAEAQLTGVIDGERRLWGDPLAELASTHLFTDAEPDEPFWRGYAEVAGAPVELTRQVRVRLGLYRAYLSTIMLVEPAPRGVAGPSAEAARRFVSGALTAQVTEIAAGLAELGL